MQDKWRVGQTAVQSAVGVEGWGPGCAALGKSHPFTGLSFLFQRAVFSLQVPSLESKVILAFPSLNESSPS